MHVPYLAMQVPNSLHISNGTFLTTGRSKVNFKFIEYSNCKEYWTTADVVENNKNKMDRPVYDLILGCNTMTELGMCYILKQKK